MKRKYKFLGSIAAITCMTAAVAISVTNCGSGGGGIGDFAWTGTIKKEWNTFESIANNQFATAQSTGVDYTNSGTMTDPHDPNMIKSVSQILGTTGTQIQQQQTWCDAFMQGAVQQLSDGGHAIPDYKFDPLYPNEDVSKYNENWKNYFESNCTGASQVDYKITFDLIPGNGLQPAKLRNFHERLTFAGMEWFDNEWHEFSGANDTIQIVNDAPLSGAFNDWDPTNTSDNENGLVNVLELLFGSAWDTGTEYFHFKQYNEDQIFKEEDKTHVTMKFYENFPTFYGSTFPPHV